jgi:DNA primase
MREEDLKTILREFEVRGQVQNRRGWIDFQCPLAAWTHARGRDSRPSAGAKISETGISAWHCHGCKEHGRVSSMIRRYDTLSGADHSRLISKADEFDFRVAKAPKADAFGNWAMQPPERDLEPLGVAYENLFPRASSVLVAMNYLYYERCITAQTADALELGYDPKQRRVMFPVRGRHGELYGYTSRGISDDVQPKIRDYHGLPKRHLILGEHRWVQGQPLVIIEGLIGYAWLVQQGIEEVASVGAVLGSAMTPEKAARIEDHNESTYLLFDNDWAGELGLFGAEGSSAIGAVTMLLGKVPLFTPNWPKDKYDPDELVLDDIKFMLDNTDPIRITRA